MFPYSCEKIGAKIVLRAEIIGEGPGLIPLMRTRVAEACCERLRELVNVGYAVDGLRVNEILSSGLYARMALEWLAPTEPPSPRWRLWTVGHMRASAVDVSFCPFCGVALSVDPAEHAPKAQL